MHGGMRYVYRFRIENAERKSPDRTPRSRWEVILKLILKNAHGTGEKGVKGFGGKARRKKTT
jgi:hypothetical protein